MLNNVYKQMQCAVYMLCFGGLTSRLKHVHVLHYLSPQPRGSVPTSQAILQLCSFKNACPLD
jgi:hypothetical protein